jgi:hypothetical protein
MATVSRQLVNWRDRAPQADAFDSVRRRFPSGIHLAVATFARAK